MITVEEREAIRRAYYLYRKSKRQIAREQGHSRSYAARAPVLRAWFSPRGRVVLTTCTGGSRSRQRSTIAMLASLQQSSTTTISQAPA